MKVRFRLNGENVQFQVRGAESLQDLLRRKEYFGTKRGCENGDCGVCTVLLDGKPVYSCLMMAGQVEGHDVTTIEGIGDCKDPHPLQRSFVEHGAAQCGFCIPGMILSAKALLDAEPDPSRERIAEAIDGNLCRCTGYVKQIDAIESAARDIRDAKLTHGTKLTRGTKLTYGTKLTPDTKPTRSKGIRRATGGRAR